MANAARVHAVEQGENPAAHTMVAFGGAAPLHACRLAEKLGVDRIVVPTSAGVGSAVGFLRAPVAYEVVRSRNMRLGAFDAERANALIASMRAEAEAVVRAGAPQGDLIESRGAFMRYLGQGHEIFVPLPAHDLTAADRETLAAAFDEAYVALFKRTIPGAEVEVLTWAVSLATPQEPPSPMSAPPPAAPATPDGEREVYDSQLGATTTTATYWRPSLAPGTRLAGPAIIAENETSTVVGSGFEASIAANGNIVIERAKGEDHE